MYSREQESQFPYKPHQEFIDNKYAELRGKNNRPESYDRLEKWISEIGFKPEEFGLKGDPVGFDAAYRQRYHRRNKKL